MDFQPGDKINRAINRNVMSFIISRDVLAIQQLKTSSLSYSVAHILEADLTL